MSTHRYTPDEVSLHQKVIELVPTFKSTLEAFSDDPKALDLFIAQVSAYMHLNLPFYSGATTSACKLSKRGKTRRFSISQGRYPAVPGPRTHCGRPSTPSFCITWEERSWFQSPAYSLLLVSGSLGGGLYGQSQVSIS
jgi:hypothetical protein